MNDGNIKRRKPTPWGSGFICAVATMVRQHKELGMAEDVIRCMGIYNIDWRKVDPSDLEALRPVLEEINRKNALAKINRQAP